MTDSNATGLLDIATGTTVKYRNAKYKCKVRKVIGKLDGYVYLRVGDNPHSVEGCQAGTFHDVYEVIDDDR